MLNSVIVHSKNLNKSLSSNKFVEHEFDKYGLHKCYKMKGEDNDQDALLILCLNIN